MRQITFFILLMLALFSSSCASSRMGKNIDRTVPHVVGDAGGYEALNGRSITDQPRMIVYRARLVLRVVDSDSAAAAISRIAEKHGGYLVSLSNRSAEIKVKSGLLQAALADLALIGKLKSKDVDAEDVTGEYTDHQVRLENAQKARQRYLELLAKAENVEAALKVEKELERLNGEIDLMQSKLKSLQHQTVFSSIHILLEQKEKLGILGYVFVGAFKAISWLFIRG